MIEDQDKLKKLTEKLYGSAEEVEGEIIKMFDCPYCGQKVGLREEETVCPNCEKDLKELIE